MSTPKPGSLDGLRDLCTRTGSSALVLEQQLTSSSALTPNDKQLLTHCVAQAVSYLGLSVALLSVLMGRSITIPEAPTSDASSSTTPRWEDVPLF